MVGGWFDHHHVVGLLANEEGPAGGKFVDSDALAAVLPDNACR